MINHSRPQVFVCLEPSQRTIFKNWCSQHISGTYDLQNVSVGYNGITGPEHTYLYYMVELYTTDDLQMILLAWHDHVISTQSPRAPAS